MAEWKKTKCGACVIQRNKPICNSCMEYSHFQPMSNADKIRAMSDEEMSTDLIPLIMEICEDGVPCEALFLAWLQSEADTKGE